VRRLAQASSSTRAALPLDDETRATLDKLAGMSRTPARGRLARRVKQLLRTADLAAIEQALDGASPLDLHYQTLERWRTRLIDGDDEDLQAFLDQYPDGDRQQLRALVRGATGEGKVAEKARRALFQALKDAAASQAP
jgi:ribosome-associated protein